MKYLENSGTNLVLGFHEQISQTFREGLAGDELLQPQPFHRKGNIQVWIFFVIGFSAV